MQINYTKTINFNFALCLNVQNDLLTLYRNIKDELKKIKNNNIKNGRHGHKVEEKIKKLEE